MKMSEYLRHLLDTGELRKDAEPMFAFYAGQLTGEALFAADGDVKSEKFRKGCEQSLALVEFIEKAAAR